MSGLSVFFGSFLQKKRASCETYDESIATRAEAEVSSPSAASPGNPEADGTEWTEPLSFSKWRDIQKKILNTYLKQRMFPGDDDDDQEEMEISGRSFGAQTTTKRREITNAPSPHESDKAESQLETQQHSVAQEEEEEKSDESILPQTPHVEQTMHIVDFLTDVDLHTKVANLKLLAVDRHWYMRKTSRPATKFSVPRPQQIISHFQGPPKVGLAPCEDDGPLSCIYQRVLSLEVTQLDQPASQLRQRVAAAMDQETSVRRMKVFFYNDYAMALHTVFSKLTKKSQRVLLQLRNIPPRCIFPCALSSWIDYDASQYCICLGGDSRMLVEDDNEQASTVRFDSPDLIAYAAILDGEEVLKEWEIMANRDGVLQEVALEDLALEQIYITETKGTRTSLMIASKEGNAPTSRADSAVYQGVKGISQRRGEANLQKEADIRAAEQEHSVITGRKQATTDETLAYAQTIDCRKKRKSTVNEEHGDVEFGPRLQTMGVLDNNQRYTSKKTGKEDESGKEAMAMENSKMSDTHLRHLGDEVGKDAADTTMIDQRCGPTRQMQSQDFSAQSEEAVKPVELDTQIFHDSGHQETPEDDVARTKPSKDPNVKASRKDNRYTREVDIQRRTHEDESFSGSDMPQVARFGARQMEEEKVMESVTGGQEEVANMSETPTVGLEHMGPRTRTETILLDQSSLPISMYHLGTQDLLLSPQREKQHFQIENENRVAERRLEPRLGLLDSNDKRTRNIDAARFSEPPMLSKGELDGYCSNAENDSSPMPPVGTAATSPLSDIINSRTPNRLSMPFTIVQPHVKHEISVPQTRKTDAVKYYRLSELRGVLDTHKAVGRETGNNSGFNVNVFGVVVSLSPPSRTTRGQWQVKVMLVDDSLSLDEASMSLFTLHVNIFATELSDLPSIRRAGDVLRLHRVRLQEFKDDLQLVGLKPTSHVVFRREESDEGAQWMIYPTSKSHFEVPNLMKQKFVNMWEWGQRRLYNHPTMKATYSFKLSDLWLQDSLAIETYERKKETAGKDVTVLVTRKLRSSSRTSGTPFGYLRVWDGTGIPSNDPVMCINSETVFENTLDPPNEVLSRLSSLVVQLRSLRIEAEPLVEAQAVTGRVVNVAIWEQSHWDFVEKFVQIGGFVRLGNVIFERYEDSQPYCLMVHIRSHVTPLPDMTFENIRLLEEHSKRLQRKDPLNQSSGILVLPEDEEHEEDMPGSPLPKRRKADLEASDGFSGFLTSGLQKKFTGIVNIAGTFPPFPVLAGGQMDKIVYQKHDFAIKLEDCELYQIDVIVQGDSEMAATLLGLSLASPNMRAQVATKYILSAITQRWKWFADIRWVLIDGAKYFVLEGIRRCKE